MGKTGQGTSRGGGFTMLELLTTILISMILLSIAIASYYLYQRQMPIHYAAQRLSRAMATARSYAVANNSIYALRLDPQHQNYWVDETDTLGSVVVPKVVPPEILGESIQLVAVTLGSTAVTLGTDLIPIKFYADGSCDDAKITLLLGDTASGLYAAVRAYGPTGQSRVLDQVDAPTTSTATAAATAGAAAAANNNTAARTVTELRARRTTALSLAKGAIRR